LAAKGAGGERRRAVGATIGGAMTTVNLTRRQFLRGLAAAGLVGVSATAAYASLFEIHDYELTETEIFLRELPAAFENFRIVQVSDVHHSSLVSLDEVRRVAELAQGARPDIVVLTGDYTTARRSYIEPCAEVLGTLQAPAGVWAVLGNHDYYTDGELTRRALKRRGIGVLDNTHTEVTRGADALQLAGVDDWSWGYADWAKAVGKLDRSRPSVLLSHEPQVFDLPEVAGVSLILSGHTHGGQVSLPFVGAPARFLEEFKYLRGRYERAGAQLYVSRGTGVVGLPIRFGARPEIAVLRLRRAPDASDGG
jgi:predicted MPP superfamily phosphohydrolase